MPPAPKKAVPRARRETPPIVAPPEQEPEQEQEQELERELTPEEQRAHDQGTLRFFGLLLAIGELVALGWAVRSHAPRTEYLMVAGAIGLLFGLPMVLAWRSLSHAASQAD